MKPWSTNPYAPKVSHPEYIGEKANFAGIVIGAMAYGIVVILFFRCLGALLDPVNRKKGGIKWLLVIHTAAMFLLVTVFTVQSLWVQSLSYVDDRDFPGTHAIVPGPFAYQYIILNKGIGLVPTVLIYVNTWLADGLLLYRCYVIYAMNYWVIALPFLMYLTSIAMGIGYTYQIFKLGPSPTGFAPVFNFGTPFYSISLSLCVLLMLMIVARLALHSKNIQNVMGSQGGGGGIYRAIYTMLIESYALYVITFMLYLGTWVASNPLAYCFFQILAETQAIAPFLVIIRVANRTALTKEAIISGKVSSINFESQGEPTGYTETHLESLTEIPSRESSGGLGAGTEMNTDEVPLTDFR